MNHAAPAVPKSPALGRPLSSTATFFLLASLTVSFLAGSSAPTPLYPTYMAEWGVSALTITVIFGIYAIAVLSALLVAGRLSDYLGRRPVLIAATAAQAVTMLLFSIASGVATLLVARVLQGLATGAAVGAVGAGMLDLDKTRGTVANAVTPPFGTALGAVVAGVLVQYLPLPTHLVYAFFGALFLLQGAGLVFMRETISPRAGVLGSLRPRLKIPKATREPLLLALPVLIAVWALGGFYASLAPLLVRSIIGSNSPLLGGLALFVLSASGGVAVLALQNLEARRIMLLGAASLFTGVAMTLSSLPSNTIWLFFLGTSIAGVGFGAGFQGAVRTVVPHAAAHERAGILSIIFIVAYLAMGGPAVLAGFVIARHGNVTETAEMFGAAVMALAAAALITTTLRILTRRGAVEMHRPRTGQHD